MDRSAHETQRSTGARPGALELLALASILVLAFFVRWPGRDFLLPSYLGTNDFLANQSAMLRGGDGELYPEGTFGAYPLLISRMAAGLATSPEPVTSGSLEEHLHEAARPVVEVRSLVVVLALGLIPLAWWFARQFLGATGGLLAAYLVASSFLHQWFSVQARPHAAAVSFFLLALLGCIALARKGGWMRWGFAGIGCALAMSALESGVALLLPLGFAAVVRLRADGWRRIRLPALIALAALALPLPLFYGHDAPPGMEAEPPEQVSAEELPLFSLEDSQLRFRHHYVRLEKIGPHALSTSWRVLRSCEPVLAALAALGCILGLIQLGLNRRTSAPPGGTGVAAMTVAAYAVPYGVVLGFYGGTNERYWIPLIPFLALLAAWGLAPILSASLDSRRPGGVRALAGGASLLLLAAPLFPAVRQAWLRTRPDTLELTARWIEDNAAGARILVGRDLDLPLAQGPEALEHNAALLAAPRPFPWLRYQLAHAPILDDSQTHDLRWIAPGEGVAGPGRSPQEFRAGLEGDLAVVSTGTGPRPLMDLRATLRAAGPPLVRFSPLEGEQEHDTLLAYQDYPARGDTPVFERLLQARAMGPVIEVYALDR